MDNLEINLDDEFKNIDISTSNNNNGAEIGIDLLMGTSPKKSENDIKSVKSDDMNSPNINNISSPKPNDNFSDPLMSTDPLMDNDPLISNSDEANGGYKPVHVLSQQDIKNEKIDLLYQFKKLNEQGVRTTSNYNMNSNLDDMRNEYIKLKKQRDVENSIKFQRKVMMAAVSGVEFLNGRFDPFDIKLDGWSESVNESISDFDEVFEQLYEKYGGGGDMAPELKLVLMLGGSAFMFHLSNTMFKSNIPNMGDIMQQNPDLMKQFAKAAVGSMGGMSQQVPPQRPMGGGMPNFMQSPPSAPNRSDMNAPEDIDNMINSMNLQPNTMPDLDNISVISGDSSNSKGITLNL
tara:strand:- start:220 stop:1263 length:1044 start_codon:yes stop_codon:yes gene_type:complete